MSTEKDTTYNGWTNRETWLVNLWLTNEPWSSEELSRIATMDTPTFSDRGDILKDWVEEEFDFPTTGLVSDLVNTAMGRVDWREIIENHADDDEEWTTIPRMRWTR